jgi:Pectate lyase superfamily protein/Right handed beta helix region
MKHLYLPILLVGLTLSASAQGKRVIRGNTWFEDNVSTKNSAAGVRTALGVASITIHNAADYGVVGDGMANDTVALQSGLTDLASTGGWLYIPEGVYNVTNTLLIPSGAHVLGAGRGKTILKEVDGLRPGITVNGLGVGATLAMVAVTNASVACLTVDHRTTTNECNGITIQPDGVLGQGTISSGCSIEDCEVLGQGTTHEYLIWSWRGTDVHIANNYCDGSVSTNSGGYMQDGIEVFAGTNVWVTGNRVRNIAGNGLNAGSATGVGQATVNSVVFRDNVVSNARVGLNTGGAYDPTNGPQDVINLKVENNVFQNLWLYGIYGWMTTNTTARDWRISGNSISNVVGAGAAGIYLIGDGRQNGQANYVINCSVTGNMLSACTNTTTTGGIINLVYWANTTLANNQINGGKYHGIFLSSYTTNCVLSGNVIEQSWGSAIALGTASHCSILGNTLALADQSTLGNGILAGTGCTNIAICGNAFTWDPANGGEYPAVYILTGDKVQISANRLLYSPTRSDPFLNNGTNPSAGSVTFGAGNTTASVTNTLTPHTMTVSVTQTAGTPRAVRVSKSGNTFTLTAGAAADGSETFAYDIAP